METTLQDLRRFFTPVIRREGGVYCAEVPSMPGCSTVAKTPDELKANLVAAMQGWLLTQQDLRRAPAKTALCKRPSSKASTGSLLAFLRRAHLDDDELDLSRSPDRGRSLAL